jgi:hypothetical protein
VSGLLAVRGCRVRQIEGGHRTDALGELASNNLLGELASNNLLGELASINLLGELASNNPLITKGLGAMLTKGIKCERSKSYALVQIIRTVQVSFWSFSCAQGVRLEGMISVKRVGEDDISDEQSLRGKLI